MYEEESQTTVEETIEPQTENADGGLESGEVGEGSENLGTTSPGGTSGGSGIIVQFPDSIVTFPEDPRSKTVMETDNGEIHVIHEITLGDIILSTLLLATLIFMVIERVIRR